MRTDPMANQKGLYMFVHIYTLFISCCHILYCSIALVELANETAAEQACTKLSETWGLYQFIVSPN